MEIDNINDYLEYSNLDDIIIFQYDLKNFNSLIYFMKKISLNNLWNRLSIYPTKNKSNTQRRQFEIFLIQNLDLVKFNQTKKALNIQKIYESLISEKFKLKMFNIPNTWKLIAFTNKVRHICVYSEPIKMIDFKTFEFIQIEKDYHILANNIHFSNIYNINTLGNIELNGMNELNKRNEKVKEFITLYFKPKMIDYFSKIIRRYYEIEEFNETLEINDYQYQLNYFNSNLTIKDILFMFFHKNEFSNIFKEQKIPVKPVDNDVKFISYTEQFKKVSEKRTEKKKLNDEIQSEKEKECRKRYIDYVNNHQQNKVIVYIHKSEYLCKNEVSINENEKYSDVAQNVLDKFMNDDNSEFKNNFDSCYSIEGYKEFCKKYEYTTSRFNFYDDVNSFIISHKLNFIYLLLNPELLN